MALSNEDRRALAAAIADGHHDHPADERAASVVERLVAEARAAALNEAAEFLRNTTGIGKRTNPFADGWYEAMSHAIDELRQMAMHSPPP